MHSALVFHDNTCINRSHSAASPASPACLNPLAPQICSQTCQHNGRCTLPDTCTCEKGWEGYDCSVPQCAQDCLNNGVCVAPDTCLCDQWDTEWFDNRNIPRPLYRKPNGDPQLTGYTGYDCSVPICVQAQTFVYATRNTSSSAYTEKGGRGADGRLNCKTRGNHDVRCYHYDEMIIANIGETFQGGCGFDPLFGHIDSFGDSDVGTGTTGCCTHLGNYSFACRACLNTGTERKTSDNFTCDLTTSGLSILDVGLDLRAVSSVNDAEEVCRDLDPYCKVYRCPNYNHDDDSGQCDIPDQFLLNSDRDGSVRIRECGHTDYQVTYDGEIVRRPHHRRVVPNRTRISGSFLCGVKEWYQGDYIDDAGLNDGE